MDQIIADLLAAPEPGRLGSFPRSLKIRADFAKIADSLCRSVEDRGALLAPEQKQALAVKLARHSAKRQWQLASVETALPDMADALSENRAAIADEEVTLTKILQLHQAHNQQAAATLRRTLLEDPDHDAPAPVILRSSCGGYALIECVTQRHMREETAALGHCIGGTSLDHYTQQMRQGKSRIFSIRDAEGRALLTIEYEPHSRLIRQIEGKNKIKGVRGNEPYFRPLCRLLFALSEKIDISRINGLPYLSDDDVITRDGSQRHFKGVAPGDILCGKIVASNSMPAESLLTLCASPRITLDVTYIDKTRLPPEIACGLICHGGEFVAPQLRVAKDIDIQFAPEVDLSQLREVHNLCLTVGRPLEFPHLRKSATLILNNCPSLILPQQEAAGDIYAKSAELFHAAELRRCGQLHLSNASDIFAPKLEKFEDMHAPKSGRREIPLAARSRVIFQAYG